MPNTHVTKNFFTDSGNELVIGGKLTFLEGAIVDGLKVSEKKSTIPYVSDCEATTVAALKESFNALLAALRTAGLMATPDEKQGGA